MTDISNNDIYTTAVKSGILNSKYSHNQFDVCATSLYTMDDLSTETVMSLKTAIRQESNCGGQGFVKYIFIYVCIYVYMYMYVYRCIP